MLAIGGESGRVRPAVHACDADVRLRREPCGCIGNDTGEGGGADPGVDEGLQVWVGGDLALVGAAVRICATMARASDAGGL